jgi:hypothetical protein
MTPSKSREEFQRKERIKGRLGRAAFRLEMAEMERTWAVVSAHREGLTLREIAGQVGLGPTRVHQIVTSPQAELVEQALSVLREAGWPAPEDPSPDAEEQISGRLAEEAVMVTVCAGWLEALAAGERPRVNLRPDEDWPGTYYVPVDQARIVRVLQRIAHDLEELARARRVADMSTGTDEVDPRLRLRRRLAEPPIKLQRKGSSIRQGQQAWEEYEDQHRKAGLPVPPNPYRHLK